MMVLYSGTTCPFSHRCRFVLFEKDYYYYYFNYFLFLLQ